MFNFLVSASLRNRLFVLGAALDPHRLRCDDAAQFAG